MAEGGGNSGKKGTVNDDQSAADKVCYDSNALVALAMQTMFAIFVEFLW